MRIVSAYVTFGANLSEQILAAVRAVTPGLEMELQHTFPGCHSVMHDIKQQQVTTEQLLAQSEQVIQTFVTVADEAQELHTKLNTAWEDLLFTQFHDLLAGTSIGIAYEDVRAMQGRALISGERRSPMT